LHGLARQDFGDVGGSHDAPSILHSSTQAWSAAFTRLGEDTRRRSVYAVVVAEDDQCAGRPTHGCFTGPSSQPRSVAWAQARHGSRKAGRCCAAGRSFRWFFAELSSPSFCSGVFGVPDGCGVWEALSRLPGDCRARVRAQGAATPPTHPPPDLGVACSVFKPGGTSVTGPNARRIKRP